MTDLLTSLSAGLAIIIAGFFFLLRFTPLRGKQAALIIAILTVGLYIPVAIVNWQGADVLAIHLAIYLITVYILAIMSSHWEARIKGEQKGRFFHWGPAIIVAFFAVVVGMNAIFITLASRGLEGGASLALLPEPKSGTQVTSYFPGTVARDYQEKEKLFNEYHERIETQHERGWQVAKGFLEPVVAGGQSVFQVKVLDADGRPLEGAVVEAHFLRPSDQRQDVRVQMNAMGAGLYRQVLTFQSPGRWHLLLTVRKGEDVHEIQGVTEIAAPS